LREGWRVSENTKEIDVMQKFTLAAATAILLLGSAAAGMAEDNDRAPGASGVSPGHEMQEHGSKAGEPGASGYAPRHEDRDDRGMSNDRQRMAGDGDRDRDDMRFMRDRDDKFGGRDRDDRAGLRDRDDHGSMRDRDDRIRGDRDYR
jgi:hypothetical protein